MQRDLCAGDQFERLVQGTFLTVNNSIKLEVKKATMEIDEMVYVYSCEEIIDDIKECKNTNHCKVFNFLQNNHFAFDSLIYDGASSSVILIQITVNKKHDVHYEEIYQFINEKPKDKLNKYHNFFNALEENKLAKTYFFQWMTNEKFTEIIDKTDKFKKNIQKRKPRARHELFIDNYSETLLEFLEKKG